MVYSSKCKATVFEIQTRNIHDSHPPNLHPQEALINSIVMKANILYDMAEMLARLEFMYCTVHQYDN